MGLKLTSRWLAAAKLASWIVGFGIMVVLLSNAALAAMAAGHVVTDTDDLADLAFDAVIVPGAGIFSNGQPSVTLQRRVDGAVNLHQTSVVDHILVSGDNGHGSYDEPTVMRRVAHLSDVPLSDITLDYAGFSTWNTCIRAKEIFGITSAVFVTQERYANRSSALCQAAGIDVTVLAIETGRGPSLRRYLSSIGRERLAAVKGLYEVLTTPEPHFGGEFVGLVGSENPANPDPVLGE